IQMECLICTEPIVHAHLGVNSCRACAVFYKRATSVPGKRLKCKGGSRKCIEQNPKTTCRACRHARFQEVLDKADRKIQEMEAIDLQEVATPESVQLPDFVGTAADVDSVMEEEEKEVEVEKEEQQATTSRHPFVSHETFFTFFESAASDTPLLDKIRKGYSLMCLIRKSGEMGTYTALPDDIVLQRGSIEFTPATYLNLMPNTRICIAALTEFANYAFEDFRNLDEESKKFLIDTGRYVMNPLDVSYRITHHFREEEEMRSPGYTTYVRYSELDKFFADCPDDVDKETVIREIRKSLERTQLISRRNYARIAPTDTEFLALFGLALWNDEIMNVNETLLKIATQNRGAIMKELHVYYAQQGKFNYAERLGNLFCLLVDYQNNSLKTREDFQLCRLMNLFQGFHDQERSRSNSGESAKVKE
ncbi:hypothetical protein PFISCL1PPCAC_12766, partial [Pristionchus fissidentatus]